MANHPYRGKPSRNTLELIATFAAGGIVLNREQQDAVAKLCRAAAAYRRLQVERCNGPFWGSAPNYCQRPGQMEEWEASCDKRALSLATRARTAILPLQGKGRPVWGLVFQGDPRGATVKLAMIAPYDRLHDDMGREGICVPGS